MTIKTIAKSQDIFVGNCVPIVNFHLVQRYNDYVCLFSFMTWPTDYCMLYFWAEIPVTIGASLLLLLCNSGSAAGISILEKYVNVYLLSFTVNAQCHIATLTQVHVTNNSTKTIDGSHCLLMLTLCNK